MPIMLGISPPFTSPRCSRRSARSLRRKGRPVVVPLIKIMIRLVMSCLRIGARDVGFISEPGSREIGISRRIHGDGGKPEHC